MQIQKSSLKVIFKFFDSTRFSQAILNDDLQTDASSLILNRLFYSVAQEKIEELRMLASLQNHGYKAPDFSQYFYCNVAEDQDPMFLVERLQKNKVVEFAYLDNGPGLPPFVDPSSNPLASSQGYLHPAPLGIDAGFAWKFKGGDGATKVKFIDIEQGWLENHEDVQFQKLDISGTNNDELADHGIAVLGIISMKNNYTGGVGIVPDARGHVVSQWRTPQNFNTGDAIMAAISHLVFGDVLLIESQIPDDLSSSRLFPVEIRREIFDAIKLATSLGIIVVEPAGNGNFTRTFGNDLDEFLNEGNENILSRSEQHFEDSGAIMVGAATSDFSHSRLAYSNFGNRIDCYAWGENITTAGIYPYHSGFAINTYTNHFGGTSGAAAIIAGAAISVQSILEAHGLPRLSPKKMREILGSVELGTPSANGKNVDKIGSMPDLKKIVESLIPKQNRILADDQAN